MMSIFSCSYWVIVNVLWRTVHSNPMPIFKMGYLSFIIEFYEFFIYSGCKTLYVICKRDFSFFHLSSLSWCYPLKHVFNSGEVQVTYFSFVSCAFNVSKKTLLNQKSWRWTLMLPSKNCIVLVLTLKIVIYLELMFMNGVRKESNFILL